MTSSTSMIYDIISSGSDGNCTVINNTIAIDMGISYRKLGAYAKTIKLVLLTHIHSDHFNIRTIQRLISKRPAVKFVCLEYLVEPLIRLVPKGSIYVLEADKAYDLGICKLSPFMLFHDVPNCGWRIMIGDWKCIYATDTYRIGHIEARNYDLYLIESNFEMTEILERIEKKRMNGEFIYEYRSINNHLSKQQCDMFLEENMGENSEYVYMHQHKEKPCEKA